MVVVVVLVVVPVAVLFSGQTFSPAVDCTD